MTKADNEIDWRIWLVWFLGFALLSAFWPRDAGFDVAHYHIHNGWSAVEGRLQRDMAPADLHSFLNPLHNAWLWGLIERWPGPIAMLLVSPVQAALLPVTYAFGARLAARLDVSVSRGLLFFAALVGFLALPNQLMLATLGNDHWGALAFIFAVVLLIGRAETQPTPLVLAVGSFVLGAAAGMKLTNLIYVIGFAVAVLAMATAWNSRARAIAICAALGALGLLLTGGLWAWRMWDMFGNPIFPNLGGLFASTPLGPDEAFRDERFLPSGWLDLLFRPFSFSLNGKLIYEFESADPRFLALYVALIATFGFCLFRGFRQRDWPRHSRLVLSLCAAIFASFLVWSAVFSIIRYALALWVIAPIFVTVLASWMLPKRSASSSFQLGLVLFCSALFVMTGPSQVRRVAWTSWTEPYVWAELPEQLDVSDGIIVFATQYPTAFLAPSVESAAWLSHADSPPWSQPALANYRPQVRERLLASDAPIFVVMFWGMDSDAEDLARTAAELGLHHDVKQCQRLRTAFDIQTATDDMHWVICPVSRPARTL